MTLEYESDADGGIWLVLPHASIDDSIADVARPLDEAERRHGRALMGFRVRVPSSEGDGMIHAIRTSPRLYIMTYDVEYLRERKVHVPGDRMVKVRIVLAGGLRALGSDIAIDGAGAFLEAYPGQVDSDYVLAPGMRQRLVILMCTPDFFTDDVGLTVAELPRALRHVFEHESGAPLASITPLGPELLRAANDVIRSASHYSGALHRRYLDAKGREMACAIVRDLARPTPADPMLAKLSVRDVNRVHEARDVLADQYRDPPTIPRLARQVGLNQTKLKSAFKAVFGLTLNDFTLQCRMERGSELLTTTGLSVGEIAYAIGYNYPANFAHAFRRYYGHAPRQLRVASGGGEGPHSGTSAI
jgi:AraC-like DNA-binding protein